MDRDHTMGIVVIIGIIAIALFGGVKSAGNNKGLLSSGNTATPQQKEANVQDIKQQVNQVQTQVDTLQKKVAIEELKKNDSQYKGIVSLSYVNRGSNTSQEYITIRVGSNATTSILVTGWTLKSESSGVSVTIPKATYLFFAGVANTEDPIYLNKNDVMYLVTGISPNGASFKVNKCSGYLSQFQTFVPYLSGNCPLPRNEDLSSIPNRTINDACLDYINSYPACKIQTAPMPLNWSYECTNFIYNKINYPSCVNTHKGDKDFYKDEWRVYLKRSDKLWKDKREVITLYDNNGKIVSTLKY